jgi:hypothetical protein
MKPRRDITLGEMQDECKKYWNNGNLGSCGKCQYMEVCCHYEDYAPARLNLTDPPRFNEAQMALLKALYANGGKKIVHTGNGCFNLERSEESDDAFLGVIKLKDGETLDLAELLGKDAT